MSAALDFNSVADLRNHYKAVRQRIYSATPKPAPVVERVIKTPARIIYDEPIGPTLPTIGLSGVIALAPDMLFPNVVFVPGTVARAREIVRECCREANITEAMIKGERRSHHIIRARHKAMYRISTELRWSLPRIGKFMGGRDHTTVLNAIRKHSWRTQTESPR